VVSSFVTPALIKDKALRQWDNQRVPSAHLAGESIFPLRIPFKKPSAATLLDDFSSVHAAFQKLQAGSKTTRGYGYTVTFHSVRNRKVGVQELPDQIYFEDIGDYIRFIGKQRDLQFLLELRDTIRSTLPGLEGWLSRSPLKALEYNANIWGKLLAICCYFQERPRPNCFVRELDIRGVESKFIEQHRSILRDLLDVVLPPEAIRVEVTSLSGSGFAKRYGLAYDEPRIRLRLLDTDLTTKWRYADLSITVSECQAVPIPCNQVFVVENNYTGLSFPPCKDSIVIFGLGYGVSLLRNIAWLHNKEILYWGDIDTHGFAILSQWRSYFPHTRSLLMDRATLLAFKDLWGRELESKRFTGQLSHLTTGEEKLFADLRDNRIVPCLRLEQERIGYGYAVERIKEVGISCSSLFSCKRYAEEFVSKIFKEGALPKF